MMYKIIFLLGFSLLSAFPADAQTDSTKLIKYTTDFRFEEGVYLSFDMVKKNQPIPLTRIVSQAEPDAFDYYDKLFEQESLIYYDENGIKQEYPVSKLWGFSRMGALFIYLNEELNRIPLVGNISHFVANYTYETQRGYDPYYSPYSRSYDPYYMNRNQTVVNKEMRQFIIDWESGNVMDYNRETMLVLLMRDTELYEEFNDLRKRKQKKMLFFYMRRYNERHPIYIPVKLNK